MDPREALILSLKREVGALQQENDHLRSALRLQAAESIGLGDLVSGGLGHERKEIAEAPKVDLEKLTELEGAELTELVKAYMMENQALRQENNELYSSRDVVLRDQEIVCRENERLLKKLEDVNSVCCRSPIIPARPTFSGDLLNGSTGSDQDTNIWTNPMSDSPTNTNGRVSVASRPVSKTVSEQAEEEEDKNEEKMLRRNKSWDQNGNGVKGEE